MQNLHCKYEIRFGLVCLIDHHRRLIIMIFNNIAFIVTPTSKLTENPPEFFCLLFNKKSLPKKKP